mmetsp:Transcript_2604/g.6009  ORF Transcript_2604/g.6009 Transcript_2604/m.6009 type:complete len:477 (+) Transcript_2604:39-1469(+)
MLRLRLTCLSLLCFRCCCMPLEGSAQCPCINVTEASYGFGCRDHDSDGMVNSECNSTSAPGWCDDHWCYVDPANCYATNKPSSRLDAHWSYTTCGYRDLFSLSNITESIRGKVLKVVFIGNTGGWKGNYCTRGQLCLNRGTGPTQRAFDLLTASAGFQTQQLQEIPLAALEQMQRVKPGGSTFDLCTWATGMGLLDVCVCSMLMVPRRTDASHFVTLWTEPTVLVGPVVQAKPSTDFGSMIGAAFRPFSPMLWLTVLCVTVVLSSTIIIFERQEHGQFNQSELGESLGDGLYQAWLGLVTFQVCFDPKTVGGRIVSLGLQFLFILLVCGYTASLASFLVVEGRLGSPVSNLNDVIRLNYKVCAHRSDAEQVLLNGVLAQNIVVLQSRADVLPSVSSSCQVAVLRQEDFEASQAVNAGSFCDLQKIGEPLFASVIGMAVSERWVRPLNYAFTSLAGEGEVGVEMTGCSIQIVFCVYE